MRMVVDVFRKLRHAWVRNVVERDAEVEHIQYYYVSNRSHLMLNIFLAQMSN